MAKPNSSTIKAIMGRALRDTGAALKEQGNAEVRTVSQTRCLPIVIFIYF